MWVLQLLSLHASTDSIADNVNKSSTYNFLNHGMQASYLSGEQTLGDYATDILQIGPIKVQKMQIGIMYQTNISENVLGVGYAQFSTFRFLQLTTNIEF